MDARQRAQGWFPLGVGIFIVLVSLLYFQCTFSGLCKPEALEIAQVAKRVASGKGLTTSVIRPLTLSYNRNISRHPDLATPPLFTIALALGFSISGKTSDTLVGALSLFSLWSAVALLGWIAYSIVGWRCASVAMLAFGLSLYALQTATYGTAATMAASFVLLWLLISTRLKGRSLMSHFTASITLGLAALIWLPALFLLPVTLWMYCQRIGSHDSPAYSHEPPMRMNARVANSLRCRHLLITCIVTVLGFSAPLALWMLRNYQATGVALYGLYPFALLLDTPAYPFDGIYRTVLSEELSIVQLLSTHLGDIFHKSVRNALNVLHWHPNVSPILCCIGMVGVFIAWRTLRMRWIALVLTASAFGWFATSIAMRPSMVSAMPVYAMICLAFAIAVTEGLQRWLKRYEGKIESQAVARCFVWLEWLVPVAAVASVVMPAFYIIATGEKTMRKPLHHAYVAQAPVITQRSNIVVATDNPIYLAHSAGLTAIWLPNTPNGWERIKQWCSPDAIVITPSVVRLHGSEWDSNYHVAYALNETFDQWYMRAQDAIDDCIILKRLGEWKKPTPCEAHDDPLSEDMDDAQIRLHIYDEVARLFIARNEFNSAAMWLKRAIRLQASAERFFKLGVVLMEMEEWTDAMRAYLAALAQQPTHFKAANNLAWVHLQRDELILAKLWGEYALQLQPDDPFVLDTVGWVAFRNGERKRALQLLRKANKLAPRNTAIQRHLKQVLSVSR